MANPFNKNKYSLFIQPEGQGTQLSPIFTLNDYTIGSINLSTPSSTRIAGTNADGSFALLYNQQDPPEELGDITVETYQTKETSYLERAAINNTPIIVQRRYIPCGLSTSPFSDYSDLLHISGIVTNQEFTESRNISPTGELGTIVYTIKPQYIIHLGMQSLLDLQPNEADNVLSVDTVNAKGRNIAVVPFAGTSGGNVIFSNDGGRTFTTITNKPFGVGSDAVSELVTSENCDTDTRIIVGSGVNPAIAYGDAVYGNEQGMSWESSTGLNSATGSVGALIINSNGNFYAAIGSDIYLSQNRGVSFSVVFSGTEAITYMTESPDRRIWAVGETGTILKQEEPNGVFYQVVSPAAGHNTVIGVSNDGTVFCGNGTKLYRSNNEAANAGGWTEISTDFASPLVYFSLISSRDSNGGDSELIMAATASGKSYFSESGGAHFRDVGDEAVTYIAGTYINQFTHLIVGNQGVMHRVGVT